MGVREMCSSLVSCLNNWVVEGPHLLIRDLARGIREGEDDALCYEHSEI